ncbi:nuclear transport factor 2 family protein [Pseudomonas sp. QL9]|uniref:nuclear transport factor 2 family protein n=1 Tax=Pseudomonas TaxID=286 RepID=UPI00352AD479
MSPFLQRFAQDFAALDRHNLDRLEQLYSPDIEFRDPLHRIHGLPALRGYFEQLYSSATTPHFTFHSFDESGEGQGYLRWTLQFSHPQLRGGRPIRVDGCTYLRWSDRVYLHHDYFDSGALLYEHLPLLGRVIAWLKRRLA